MPTPTNAITTADINYGIEVDVINQYEASVQRLLDILGIFGVDIMKAGQIMRRLKVTGELNADALNRDEGDIVPLSKYKLEPTRQDPIGMVAHRKLTTGEAILQSTYEKAVLKTDKKFGDDALTWQFDNFVDWLEPSEATVTGRTLQAALALGDAKLADVAETNGYTYSNVVHFIPRKYVTDFLASSQLTLTGGEMIFGMLYLQSFLGITNVFVTNKVQTIITTPTDNVKIYGLDFAELAKGDLAYTVGKLGLIGIAHEPAKDRVSTQTHLVMPKNNFYCEVEDFVISGEVAEQPTPTPTPDATLASLTIGSLTLTPTFDPATTSYAAATENATNTVTAVATDETATVAILNGETPVTSGSAATWAEGANTLTVTVTNGTATKTYTVTVTKS